MKNQWEKPNNCLKVNVKPLERRKQFVKFTQLKLNDDKEWTKIRRISTVCNKMLTIFGKQNTPKKRCKRKD